MAVPRAPPPTKMKEKKTQQQFLHGNRLPKPGPFRRLFPNTYFRIWLSLRLSLPLPNPGENVECRGGNWRPLFTPESWSEAADDKRASGGDRAKIETDRLEFRPERMEAFTIGTQTHALVEAWIRGVRSYSGRFTDPSLIGFRAILKKKSTAAFYLYFLKV